MSKPTKTMKFKDYVNAGKDGFLPTPALRWVIRTNDSPTAREEAIAAKVLRAANPRENITGSYPWGEEQQMVLQQLWRSGGKSDWRDVPIEGAEEHYTTEEGLTVPNAVKEPGQVVGNFDEKLKDILGDDYCEPTE